MVESLPQQQVGNMGDRDTATGERFRDGLMCHGLAFFHAGLRTAGNNSCRGVEAAIPSAEHEGRRAAIVFVAGRVQKANGQGCDAALRFIAVSPPRTLIDDCHDLRLRRCLISGVGVNTFAPDA